jgi:plastocyanin
MSRRLSLTLGATVVLALAACTSGGSGATPETTSAPASAAASEAPAAGGGACTVSTDAGTVAVTVEGFSFQPSTIEAGVGDVIAFTNKDSASHTATLDDGSCDTGGIAADATGALSFSAAGSYPFHCTIHPDMTGTIEVSG